MNARSKVGAAAALAMLLSAGAWSLADERKSPTQGSAAGAEPRPMIGPDRPLVGELLPTGQRITPAAAGGRTVRNYGFFGDLFRYFAKDDTLIPLDRDPFAGQRQVFFPSKPALAPHADICCRGFDMAYPDFYLVNDWRREFALQVETGAMPNLTLLPSRTIITPPSTWSAPWRRFSAWGRSASARPWRGAPERAVDTGAGKARHPVCHGTTRSRRRRRPGARYRQLTMRSSFGQSLVGRSQGTPCMPRPGTNCQSGAIVCANPGGRG